MKNKILNFIDQDKKLKGVNNEINEINNEIYSFKKEQNNSRSWSLDKDKDISSLEEQLRIKKEHQNQLIDTRNYFIFKLFWNIIVPILISVITTVLINIYLK